MCSILVQLFTAFYTIVINYWWGKLAADLFSFCLNKAFPGFARGVWQLMGNDQSETFPSDSSLYLPHKTKRLERSIGVLVFPELRSSGVCFIMVLGALQPDISHPWGTLRSTPIYQSLCSLREGGSAITPPNHIHNSARPFFFPIGKMSRVITGRPLWFSRCCLYCD